LSRRWHHDSIFGDGPRVPLDREQRARWKGRIVWLFHLGRVTRACRDVGLAMADFLGADGRLDPSHEAIARRAHAAPRTVRTALACLSRLGVLSWVRRLVRVGDCVAQISNAYVLLIGQVLSGGNCCPRSGKKVSVRCYEQDATALAKLMAEASALPDLLLRRRQAWAAGWRAAL
jgi:hypothetical protein